MHEMYQSLLCIILYYIVRCAWDNSIYLTALCQTCMTRFMSAFYSYAPVMASAKRRLRVNFWSLNDRMDVLLLPFLNVLPSSEVNAQFFLADFVVVINANLFWMFSIDDDDDESDDDGLLRLRSAYRMVRFDDGECALSSYSWSILANLKSSFSCFSCCRIFSRKLPFFGTAAATTVDGFVRLDAVHSSITFSCCCNFVPRFLLLVLLLLLLLILLQVIVVFVFVWLSSATTTPVSLRRALPRAKLTGALLFVSALLADNFIGWNMLNADRRWIDVNFCLNLL